MPLRPQMTGWYNPPRLISTGIRVAISTVFGEFADRREAMAAAREIDPLSVDVAYDYGAKAQANGFWIDFVADTGDGWNPTYAVARLLADPSLLVDGHATPLPRAQVLIMGGDQVYPTASRDDYQAKLLAPFNMVVKAKPWPADTCPHVYAIPGNHDWYDGLSAFIGLFCRRRQPSAFATPRDGRLIGGRQTYQTRSYFALRLPHGWWLWGADIQLEGYIDQPQIDFFSHVAGQWMEPGSRVILCTGQPSWAYVDPAAPERTFKNFSYLEGLPGLANHGHRLCLVLSGDSHHYCRATEDSRQYITAGGGGAFLHPTHHLESKSFQWTFPPPGGSAGGAVYTRNFNIARDQKTGTESLFPDRETSRKLTWRNVAFALLNWPYTLTLGLACAFFAWLLETNATIMGSTLSAILAPDPPPSISQSVFTYFALICTSPWPIALLAVAAGGYYYFSDFQSFASRITAGLLHTLTQFGVVVVASILLARALSGFPNLSATLIISIGFVGGFSAATVMGLYLLICLNSFKRHWNEAFSALRIEGYKCFLRMCIDADGTLTVYPIGLADVPADDSDDPPLNPLLTPHLIETPISIR